MTILDNRVLPLFDALARNRKACVDVAAYQIEAQPIAT